MGDDAMGYVVCLHAKECLWKPKKKKRNKKKEKRDKQKSRKWSFLSLFFLLYTEGFKGFYLEHTKRSISDGLME